MITSTDSSAQFDGWQKHPNDWDGSDYWSLASDGHDDSGMYAQLGIRSPDFEVLAQGEATSRHWSLWKTTKYRMLDMGATKLREKAQRNDSNPEKAEAFKLEKRKSGVNRRRREAGMVELAGEELLAACADLENLNNIDAERVTFRVWLERKLGRSTRTINRRISNGEFKFGDQTCPHYSQFLHELSTGEAEILDRDGKPVRTAGADSQREVRRAVQRKNQLRAEIEQLTEVYLAEGGTITVMPEKAIPACRRRVRVYSYDGQPLFDEQGQPLYHDITIRQFDPQTGQTRVVARPLPFSMW